MKAQREHQTKLKSLKQKLRKLRARLKALQSDYSSQSTDEDQQETEKSEMDTLKDLKTATEEAILELQRQATQTAKKASNKKGEVFISILSSVRLRLEKRCDIPVHENNMRLNLYLYILLCPITLLT